MGKLFFKPFGSVCGDFIPFHDGNEFRLFYLRYWRDIEEFGEGTPWYQVSTKDFVHFTDHGEMIPRGTKEEQDLYIFTGSVIKGPDRYHIFYTGFNPFFRKNNKKAQAILHATSDDLVHWTKIPEDILFAPDEGYEPDDWRDPFVFWNEEAKEYWMLLAARLKKGPSRRKGCTALCTSKDLKHWDVKEPFWAPNMYFTHECPDLFKMGDWWYLVFSEFSERILTRYCMSKSLRGPWISPPVDTFDGRGYYAAKTASDGKDRYAFGWNGTRNDFKDDGVWNWGGNLIVHRIVQGSDGTLRSVVPSAVDGLLTHRLPLAPAQGVGTYTGTRDAVELDTRHTFACASLGTVPDCFKLEMEVRFDAACTSCGVMLKTDKDLESSYYIRLEPSNGRVVFDKWPRPGDVSFINGLERPIHLAPDRTYRLKILVDGTVGVIYVDEEAALSVRFYELKDNGFGVFASGGKASFSRIALTD